MPCSGIHRSLGTHITQVRSVDLDTWKPEWLEVMKTWGNIKANSIWEAKMPKDFEGKPSEKEAQDLTPKMQKFIRDKYERKKWYAEPKKSKKHASSDEEDENGEEEEEEEVKPKKSSSSKSSTTAATTSTGKKAIPAIVMSKPGSKPKPQASAAQPAAKNDFESFNPFEDSASSPKVQTQEFSAFTGANSVDLLSLSDPTPAKPAVTSIPQQQFDPFASSPVTSQSKSQVQAAAPPAFSQPQPAASKPGIDLSSLYGALPTQTPQWNPMAQPQQPGMMMYPPQMQSQPQQQPQMNFMQMPQAQYAAQPSGGFPQMQQGVPGPFPGFPQQQQQQQQPGFPHFQQAPPPSQGFSFPPQQQQQPMNFMAMPQGFPQQQPNFGGMFPPPQQHQQQPAASGRPASNSLDPFSNLMG